MLASFLAPSAASSATDLPARAATTFNYELCKNKNVFQSQFLKSGLWIRIRIGSGFNDFVDPNWESGSGSRDKKMKKNK
jgi:hypothetical protein